MDYLVIIQNDFSIKCVQNGSMVKLLSGIYYMLVVTTWYYRLNKVNIREKHGTEYAMLVGNFNRL